MPPRSYKTTYIRKIPNTKKMDAKIQYLKSKPQPDQRTQEWYLRRYNMITASNAWKILDSQSNVNSIIYEKCTPLNTEKYTSVNVDSPFHWGQKYEPLSVQIYEKRYNTKVEDFGCIPHPDYPNAGASPDGINTCKTSGCYGHMLEVKNRASDMFPITGIPKKEYWVQMQIQMGVCGLDYCDFLETKFAEYGSYEEYEADKSSTKGMFMYFNNERFL